MKILEEMLEVETKARQVVEDAKLQANDIRTKAREDAKQFLIDGKNDLHNRLLQDVEQMKQEAEKQKEKILNDIEAKLAAMEQMAGERMEHAVNVVINTFFRE